MAWRKLMQQSACRRLLRGLLWLSLAAYFAFIALILVLRHLVLPGVADHLSQIEQAASQAIGQTVRIERVEAGWRGLNPRLSLSGVKIVDRQGLPALAFERVESVLSWHSLWHFRPILSLLAIDGPVLHVRRDTAGRIAIAGMSTEGDPDPRFAEWVLAQRRIRINNATIVWDDALRAAPPLILEDLYLALDQRGARRWLGLSAVPPASLAARIDLRAELRGDPLAGWQQLSGRLFTELTYADLAAWRTWIDYPLPLRQGRGALRLWLEREEDRNAMTADLALEDVRVRFSPELPELALATLRGRLGAEYGEKGGRFSARQLELSAQPEGAAGEIRLLPSDLFFSWQRQRGQVRGEAKASLLDLQAGQRLAAYLPLPDAVRESLRRWQPQGRISDLRAEWQQPLAAGKVDAAGWPEKYRLRADFAQLGLAASDRIPGASGLSGQIDASEAGGSLRLSAPGAEVELPGVFAEPKVAFSELDAALRWQQERNGLDVTLEKLSFANADAAGSFTGRYRWQPGEGPGEIDLSGGLSRANGTAVWRYMPLVVNDDTRQWLRRGILAGQASDTRLVLRGDLRHFPFADKKQGEFRITTKAHGVKLDYAPGWPVIEGIEADLAFGVGMQIEAHAGRILGARLGRVSVQLPDFDVMDEQLLLQGEAEGPTAEFLRFIDQSPVAAAIDHFSEDMRASGNGRLALKFVMPLRRTAETRIDGQFSFLNNQIVAVPGLPAVTRVNGQLLFSEKQVTTRDLAGQLFGAPLRVAVKNEGGRVDIGLAGGAEVRALRQHWDLPLFDHLAGQTAWKGEVRVRKKQAEFVFESTLQGMSSALPAPFNKSATTALPLRLEKTLLAAEGNRERLRLTLGKIAEAQAWRQEKDGEMQLERAAIGVGTTLPAMPSRGVLAEIRLPQVDADFWSGMLTAPDQTGQSDLPLRVQLETPSLRVAGREFADFSTQIRRRTNGWQLRLNAPRVAGQVDFLDTASGGRLLRADLQRLYLPPATGTAATRAGDEEAPPALDIKVADFAFGEKKLGQLALQARPGAASAWQLERLQLQNVDATLLATGDWQAAPARTRLDFELQSGDVGDLLDRFGYPGQVKRGSANLQGKLSWAGSPTSPHYPSLSGTLKLRAEKGQFAKLEPGIGKLLGLLSLQSIPRRLTLDFRDIFSSGLAFDRIEADIQVRQGRLHLEEPLRIDGPAARILMRGEVDLVQETQALTVSVQPEIGSAAAVGAAVALVNPIAGAAALIANKVLQNPLDKVFAYQYRIVGGWDDPKVEKLAAPPAASQEARP